jgi:hypothetical protein
MASNTPVRVCTRCGVESPATREFFHRRGRQDDRLDSWCRVCRLEHRRQQYQDYLPRYKAKSQVWRMGLRMEALRAYGGTVPACACCGESTVEFLSVDHINGGGRQHRLEVGMRGGEFYRWLKNNGYPTGYRVLCHNCNMAMGFYGRCPHQVPTTA